VARTAKVVEDRRAQIIEAALRVFAQKGFVRATNKDVANEAGITPGLIYHYFKSKEALLQAIIEEASPVQSIRTLPPDILTQSPETLLRFLVGQMLDIAESKQFLQLVRVVLPELLHNQNILPNSLSTLQELTQFLEHYLATKMENGELRHADPALTAQVIMGTVSGFVLRRQVFHDPLALQYTRDQIVESVISTLLSGLLPH
jgi:AcrR family transcriptional regulator